ncbi:mRNA turnover protein 4 homolog [Anthonomus grandis grandis]|uniref:mRNA turnover protein 4 homolog n=1 Tax=Anthonomus grandis grandis TaxID=2921223 RepID=UPI0021668234|nr:mRNA turnover protein 4 homolog [Anthonomus grandis grandis]
MPKSKRDKKISLTKTDKKGLQLKQKIVEDVRGCVEKFNSIYLFTFKNMRNEKMKEVREIWKPSKFFFGKNKVIAIGLGRNAEEEVADGLHKFSKCLKGQCGLLFTDCTKQEVVDWFEDYSVEEYARSGFKATKTVTLKEGPLKQFAHSIEPYLRQLGMPTKLDRGVVTLIKDFEVCKEGSILTPEQAKILELLEHRLATFKLILKAKWTMGEGFEKIISKNSGEGDEDEEMESEREDD